MMVIDQPPQSPPVHPRAQVRAHEPPRREQTRKLAAFRALFWLEFAPFVPLAVALLLIALVLAGLLAWDDQHKHTWIDRQTPNLLLIAGLQSVVAGWCALVGIVTGVCQARANMNAAVWGFIKQRPAGAWLMFVARGLAGASLYALAVGPPMAWMLFAASRQVPFEWHFMLPALADGLAGLIYYLTGLVVVERRARFYGSRLMPVVSAVVVSIGVWQVRTFGEALLILLAAAIVFGLAALGAQSGQGYRVRTPVATRVALGIVLFCSYSALLAGLAFSGESLLRDRAETRMFAIRDQAEFWQYFKSWPRDRGPYVSYVLLPDGTLGKQIYAPPPGVRGSWADGTGFMDGDSSQYCTYTRATPLETPVTGANGNPHDVRLPRAQFMYPIDAAQGYHEIGAVQVQDGAEKWWRINPVRILQLYDAQGRYQGALGAEGFVTSALAQPSDDLTSAGSDGHVTITTAQGIYDANLTRRTSSPTWRFPTGVHILGTYAYYHTFFLVSAESLFVYDAGTLLGSPAHCVRLARRFTGFNVRIAHLDEVDRWAIIYALPESEYVDIYDANWNAVAQMEVPPLLKQRPTVDLPPPPAWFVEGRANSYRQLGFGAGALHAACDLPCLMWLDPTIVTRLGRDFSWWYENFGSSRGENPSKNYLTSHNEGAVGMLLCSGLLAWWLALRYDARWKMVWLLASLLLGPVVLLLLMSVHTLPGRTTCAGCGRKRFVHAARCANCGAIAPVPPAVGNEIFAAVAGGNV